MLESFSTIIDPEVAEFAIEYFQSRFVLATTAVRSVADRGSNENELDDHSHTVKLRSSVLCDAKAQHFDPYIGCSVELVDIIDKIMELSQRTGHDSQPGYPDPERIMRARVLEERTHQSIAKNGSIQFINLRKSTEAFQFSILIYLQLTCFGSSPSDTSIVEYHHRLMICSSDILVNTEGRRQMFPMWPLFIAGCTCSSEQQRTAVWECFVNLRIHWPFHNVSAIERALWTIWQVRDNALPLSRIRYQDWQDTMSKFGWKLSLT